MEDKLMGDGNVLCSLHLDTKKPLAFLPRFFAYVHTIADSPSYFSEGRLRLAENHCVFHYTLRGQGVCWKGQQRQTTSPGQGFLAIINDPESGYCYPAGQTGEWEFVCFCFEGGNAMEMARELIGAYGQVYTIPPDAPIIRELRNEETWRRGLPLSPFESSRYFYELYGELVRSASLPESLQYHPLVQDAKNVLRKQLLENPSIDQLAQQLGLSREHLSRLFHNDTGKKLKDYIREERVVAACRMLKETNLTIQEIAEAMNCSSPANFIRFFRQTMKMTPAAFRRKGNMPIF